MTKQVRIENADTSDHKLMVQVWNKVAPIGGKEQDDVMVEQVPLNNPCDMIEKYVYDTQYLVIKEVA